MDDDDVRADRDTREMLRLSAELMSAQTHADSEAALATMQPISDFIFADERYVLGRLGSYMNANGHLSSFLVDFAARSNEWDTPKMLEYVVQHVIQRTDADEDGERD